MNAVKKRHYSDDQLIALLQSKKVQDNQLALTHLHSSFQTTLSYLKGQCCNLEDAKTIYGDALLALYNNVRERNFKRNATLNTYFQGIVKKRLGKYYRYLKTLKVSATSLGLEGIENKPSDKYSPERTLLLKEIHRIFKELLKECSPRTCQVINCLIEGDTTKELAEKLGMTPSVAKQTKSRAIRSVKNLIEKRPKIQEFLKEFYDEIRQS